MRSTKPFLLACSLLLGMSPAAFSSQSIDRGTVTRKGDSIFINGAIFPGMEVDFRRLLDSAVRSVVVTSEGGETGTAMAIGEAMRLAKLNVVVEKYCISSCANYIFVSGAKKVVKPRSVVAWHGGHSNYPFPREDADQRALIRAKEMLHREQVMYLRLRVSLDLIVYSGLLTAGKLVNGTHTVTIAGTKAEIRNAIRDFTDWIPNRQTLERLGVTGITSFWHPGGDAEASRLLQSFGFTDAKAFTGAPYSHVPTAIGN